MENKQTNKQKLFLFKCNMEKKKKKKYRKRKMLSTFKLQLHLQCILFTSYHLRCIQSIFPKAMSNGKAENE